MKKLIKFNAELYILQIFIQFLFLINDITIFVFKTKKTVAFYRSFCIAHFMSLYYTIRKCHDCKIHSGSTSHHWNRQSLNS